MVSEYCKKNSTLNTGVFRKLVSVTAVVLKQPCQGDAVFLCESERTLYDLLKVDAFRNHYDYLQ